MENILSTPELKTRIIDLEYKHFSPKALQNTSLNEAKDNFEKDFKKIYLEETGELLEGDLTLFHSSQSNNKNVNQSSYDGTALYIDNGKTEEVYIISQGTQDSHDWEYNIKAMFAGQSSEQADATKEFVLETYNTFQISGEINTLGLSHSLAHNNNTTAHLAFDTFDEIFSVNGAQTNYYQLYHLDLDFQIKVNKEFPIFSDADIYDIPPQELHDFARDYYSDKEKNITQLISEDDPLYAVSGIRGFLTLGSVQYINTNPTLPGLREIVDDIPDDIIVSFQKMAIDYAIAAEQGGMNAGIEKLLGVNPSLFEDKSSGMDYFQWYITSPSEVDTVIRDLNDNVPILNEKIKIITDNSELIFGRLYEAGYITKKQQDTLITEFGNLQHELNEIQELIERNISVRDLNDAFATFGADSGTIIKIMQHGKNFTEIFKNIQDSNVLHNLEAITDSHSLIEMLSSINGNGSNKSYLGRDMVLTSSKGENIQINISAALRMYQQCFPLLGEKSTMINNLENAVIDEIQTAFNEEKQKVMSKINEMEASPGLYRDLLRKHIYFPRLNKTVRQINVHEAFLPLEQADLDEEISYMRQSVEKGKKHIETYRTSIEDLFEAEDHVSDMFKLIGRI
ncbi:hypothetical conserved protein [Oceanobacillus iheyensis HTE831]|uniref:Hypothetical conserved protein n=1 Tax=Oceanobacillus iheyensis (strain DSM 14371 / CIP 107618 / JCM 11309 / KCTC 3954 / HTE831) TaxID=221109 RepID=Q8ERL1_OCEIH|nr:DUF6792 domain-containing protein [Oceanobacillus iheyensis]BAC13247.1 hypothetical conserved protein [Oceanobacillus iheyensis HTE831]